MTVKTAKASHFAKNYKQVRLKAGKPYETERSDKPFLEVTAPFDTLRAGLRNLLIRQADHRPPVTILCHKSFGIHSLELIPLQGFPRVIKMVAHDLKNGVSWFPLVRDS